VIGSAVKVMRIATGEEIETLSADDGAVPAAKTLGPWRFDRRGPQGADRASRG
jgi:hypothetical protein